VADGILYVEYEFFPFRASLVNYTGILAIGAMSVAMILATRPVFLEPWLGGLDKMYRLHKWLGIGALVLAITHWLWTQGPKWAVGFGWLQRPRRGPPPDMSGLEQALRSWRGTAESVGELAFYVAVILIAIALIKRIPYRFFYATHALLAVVFLVLVFHAIVLVKFAYWATPLGVLVAALLIYGTWAAIVVLFRRVGANRRVAGTITKLSYLPEISSLEGEIGALQGWPGHRPGQFAFVSTDDDEHAHPFTIASTWNAEDPRLTFVVKELGDYTRRLPQKLRIGQPVRIEGPYGYFTFNDDLPRQIWVGGGIGITPFIARMKQLAMDRKDYEGRPNSQAIDLFHSTAQYSEEALAKLHADAEAAGVNLHVLYDPRDGLLTGDRIREAVPDWKTASMWFCGPPAFGAALRADFAKHGLPVDRRFHQELFAMR
jgi:predicted ferric reductase